MNILIVWVVKSNDGILRPLAGIWKSEEEAREYELSNKLGDTVVQCELREMHQ